MSVSTYDTEKINTEDYIDTVPGIDIMDSRRFFSEGRNGRFELRAFITRIRHDSRRELFNIGFGVWDQTRQAVDDKIQTRNDDMRLILGTITVIVLEFLQNYPFAYVYAEGSTLARTRLYQREISKILDELPGDLLLYGLISAEDIGFIKFRRGINFEGFLLSLSNR
ncbi:DUF6934 family protein [Dyadobacter pollutisoli]|uniref:Uncharacterized protein n=1 Tax=Dyadobacter pollutisoli TaxID=2910158 RepID=A0A9E8SN21_9BACT|nr:hypothetical protein [Dyadobacter pollutisoli]WAC14793.1 hypothetical protein ON006_12680 [Dyadobacter pollutisoli]